MAQPNDNSVVFFAVCDDGYLVPSVIALESIKRFHPDSVYFIVGLLQERKRAEEILTLFDIHFLEMNLHDTFKQPHVAGGSIERWSVACFGHFGVHEQLRSHGFNWSCCVDGDTICLQKIDFSDVFNSSAAVSGVMQSEGWLNSGILFYNNVLCNQVNLLEKTIYHYHHSKICSHEQCSGYCCELGDQELLLITLERESIPWQKLHPRYNYFLPYPQSLYEQRNTALVPCIDDCVFIHLMLKPWMPEALTVTPYPILTQGYKRWKTIAEQVLALIK